MRWWDESTEARIAHRLQVHPYQNGTEDLISIDRITTGSDRQQQRGESPSIRGERTEYESVESEIASRYFRKLLAL